MIERRNKRSNDPIEALTLLLESQRQALGVAALTVETRDGVVLAASQRDGADEQAANGARVATWELHVGTQELVISSVGGRLSHDIGSGVQRIANGHP